MDHVADLLDMAPIRVYEVATFYTCTTLKPVGTLPPAGLHHDALLAARLGRRDRRPAGGKLGIGIGETTADGMFTCARSSAWAPASTRRCVQINDDFYEDLDDADDSRRCSTPCGAASAPKPGPQIGRADLGADRRPDAR